jgi:hypothetical protein
MSCVFMLYSSISYALSRKPLGLLILAGVLLAGIFVFRLTEGKRAPHA